MSTLPDRNNPALLVIDVQNGVVGDAWERDRVVANINACVATARTAGAPVIWIQDAAEDRSPGSEPWQLVPELSPAADDVRVQKLYGDSFEDTTLESELAARGVGRVYITGAQTDACVRSTLHGAFVRGYDTVLVGDAHTTGDLSEWGAPPPDQVVAHTNLYWAYQSAPGRRAAVVNTDELDLTEVPPLA